MVVVVVVVVEVFKKLVLNDLPVLHLALVEDPAEVHKKDLCSI